MPVNISWTTDQSEVKRLFEILPDRIRDELTVGITNSIRKVYDTINQDYKRSGSLHPSYLNPSASGRGFTDRTGSLRQSIQFWVEESSKKTTGYVSAGTDYDKYVELLWGGKYSFMFPALMQNQEYIINEIAAAILRAIERV